jgi:peroxiredoxin
MELDALNKAQADFEALGARLVAVTPHHPEFSTAMQEEKGLTFAMLTDPGNETANTYGLRHKLPDDLITLYTQFGIDLPKFNGDDSWTLPMPARYIIDTSGVVQYAEVNADYTKRPEPDDTVAALKELVGV